MNIKYYKYVILNVDKLLITLLITIIILCASYCKENTVDYANNYM